MQNMKVMVVIGIIVLIVLMVIISKYKDRLWSFEDSAVTSPFFVHSELRLSLQRRVNMLVMGEMLGSNSPLSNPLTFPIAITY